MRDWLIYIENKINSGHGAYWLVMRSRALKMILKIQLKEFNREDN